MEENMLYLFLFALFSLLLIFTLKAASISHFLSATTKFSCCSSNKICLLCFFLFLALALCHSFSRWASLAFRLLSLFLCLCLSLYNFQIYWRDNKSKLNTLENTDTKVIFAFCFWLYWLFNCLGGYVISLLALHWVILHWYACGTDGWGNGYVAASHYQNFSDA